MLKDKKIIGIIILLIIVIMSILLINNIVNKKITIIQLSPHSKIQMMGYIIKTKNGKIIAIDGGLYEDTDNFVKYIKEFGGRIDYWFITHNHNDHASVLLEVINRNEVEIDNIYISLNDKDWYMQNEFARHDFTMTLIDTLQEEGIKSKVREPQLNEKIKIDGINVEILGIRNPEITSNAGNEQSMVIKFDTGKTSLLILGDTGVKSSEKLLINQKDKLKADIVQMSHHGQNGATKELYETINPKICLWPTPEWLWNNDDGQGYGTGPWKTLETRQWMQELNVKTHYVEKDGDIIFKIK